MFDRVRIELEDRLRYHPQVRSLLAGWKASRVKELAGDDPQALARAIQRLSEALRLAVAAGQVRRLEERIGRLVKRVGGRKIDWREFESTAEKRVLENAAILKPCLGLREKGVIYLSFEYQWPRLLQNCDIRALSERYHLVLSPVWVCPYDLVNYLLPTMIDGPVFSHLSDPRDAEILPRMAANYVTVPLLCSSWVNPAWYQPVPAAQKDLDIFMLANFGKYKRHFALFKALRELPREFRVLLIGQHNGRRTRETLMAEARAYGVEGRFELKENATDAEVFGAFARARTSLILSKREGSCIAVVESLLANTPVGLVEGAEVGSRQFLNERTGRFLRSERLAEDLLDFVRTADRYEPRAWAMENEIHCHGSSATLNRVVRQTCRAQGMEWTRDLAPFHWRPQPRLLQAEDREWVRPAYAELKERFGMQIGKTGEP